MTSGTTNLDIHLAALPDPVNLANVRDWDRMVTFYRFPRQHWRHLRTTNPLESPFATLRLRTDAAKRFKRVDNATAVIWKMLRSPKRNSEGSTLRS